MAIRSLGRVTVVTSGTPVRATFNEVVEDTRYPIHAMLFQRDVTSETGLVYILANEDAVIATRVGVIAILAIPTSNILPSFSATITLAAAGLDLRNYFIDADNDGEGCIVSAIRA